MPEIDRDRRREEATAIFKLGLKASKAGVHRTLNRPPRGKGWVQCVNSPAGLMCRPDKVRESIAHFERAYQKFPDIVALNQIALGYEMLGELEAARQSFSRMREQALAESIAAYVQAAELGLARLT
jgi:tetratricopeptide (TPR) repeat protein